jgi:hypothetical protein
MTLRLVQNYKYIAWEKNLTKNWQICHVKGGGTWVGPSLEHFVCYKKNTILEL